MRAMDVVPETDPWMRRRSLPAGGERLFLPLRDGWPVRLEHWPRRNPERGHMLMVTGRADFVEKYAEALHELVDAGWGVTIFDWRGQGLSRRVGKTPMHGASPGFDIWLDDLAELAAWTVERVDDTASFCTSNPYTVPPAPVIVYVIAVAVEVVTFVGVVPAGTSVVWNKYALIGLPYASFPPDVGDIIPVIIAGEFPPHPE